MSETDTTPQRRGAGAGGTDRGKRGGDSGDGMSVRGTLQDLCSIVTDGTHDSPKLQSSGVPFIKGKNISGGRVDFATCDFISDEDHAACVKRIKPQRGDILFSNIGSVGDTAVVDSDIEFSIKNVALFRPDPSKADPRYVYYLVCSDGFRSGILNQRSGAAQPFISLGNLRSFEFNYDPDLPTQRRIAGILSAYDDLIENNLRRIRILEEMAQSLYREWFVHFRFPGHESVPLIDSPLGPIPDGWEVKPVGQCFEVTGGGTPSKTVNEYWDGGAIQWYFPRDLTSEGTMFMERSADQITELGLKKSSARMFPARSVMLTSRATIGAIAINTVPACTNQGFITCLPNDQVPLYFLYQWLKVNVETFISHASGSTFKEISKGVFRSLNFLLPPQELVVRYEVAVTPLSEQLLNLQRRNQTLRQTRDLLLPKLLSPSIP